MIDMRFIRENPELVKKGLARKYDSTDIDKLIQLDENRREIIRKVEQLKADRNRASGEIAKAKRAGESADKAIAEMRQVGEDISVLDEQLRGVEQNIQDILVWIPNLPHESVPMGEDESAAVEIRKWGDMPKQDFEVLPHWEIGEKLGILDLAAAARISGSGFYVLKGMGARLQRALVNFMLDVHISDGFTEIAPPFIVNEEAMFGTGQLPKMAEDMYKTEGDNMYLVPTGEVPVTNLFRGEVVSYKDLPMSFVCYSPCFRREAGAAGKDTRGMIRVHQFDKVELVKIVRPESSYDDLESLTEQAEKILQALEIPYRLCTLPTGDLSFAAAKCYDLELWATGVAKYLEISSVSNFEDFQARRMNCRFRDEDKRVKFPHTLNGSGVALARLIPAILENYQNSDGSVTIPQVLRPYMGGAEKID